jgi:hypothetical protein
MTYYLAGPTLLRMDRNELRWELLRIAIMKKILAVFLFPLCLSICLPTVAGVAAYKMSQNRTQNQYCEYVADVEKTNQ